MTQTLHEIFEAQAERTAEAIAVSRAGSGVTYRDLNQRANQLARYLRRQGAGPGVIVGIHLERSIDTAVAILGTLKCGSAYLPLDADYPPQRIAFALEDSATRLLVTREPLLPALPPHATHICLDRDAAAVAMEETANLASAGPPADDLMYVMYTSGSTGRPKGVMVTHANVARLFSATRQWLPFGSDDVWAWFHSFAFGYSVWEFWGALLHGGRLVVMSADECHADHVLFRNLRTQKVTVLCQTPSAFRQLLLSESFDRGMRDLSLRYILFSGEAVVAEDIARWLKRHGDSRPQLASTYAITEAGGQVCYLPLHRGNQAQWRAGSLGQCLPDMQLHLLDAQQCAVAAGAEGEMYVGGAGVARGYLNDAQLTAYRFIHHPRFGRLYRTGDRARCLSDGTVAFAGRADHQVKIRGARLELGEVEAALREHPAVRDAVAAVHRNAAGDQQLVAYVVGETLSAAEPLPQPDVELWPSLGDHQIYDEVLYHFMSQTAERIAAYRAAIDLHVRDKVVLDLGTGAEAVLARLCVEAGARHVYAVEVLEHAYRQAVERIRALGLQERVTVMHGDAASMQLPQPVDVCIQAVIGNIASADGVIPIMNGARRLFKPDAVSIPHACTTYIAPVQMPRGVLDRPAFSELAASYVRRLFDQAGQPFDLRICVRNFPMDHRLSPAAVFEHLDFTALVATEHQGEATFHVTREASFDGFLLWIQAHTAAGHAVDHGTFQQAWLPVYFPVLYPGTAVCGGDVIEARWTVTLGADGLHPDYTVSGRLVRQSGGVENFGYTTRHRETAYGSTGFHQRLLSPQVQPLSIATLRAHVARILPQHAMPSLFVFLEALPLNPSGKLDRDRLPPPSAGRQLSSPLVAPRNDIERAVAEVWRDVLKVDAVGVRDNFFELGGDSISAIRVFMGLRKLFGLNFLLSTLVERPTVEQLADLIHHPVETRFVSLVPLKPEGRRTPLFCVHGAGGNIVGLQPIAAHLDAEQPLYALQAVGLHGTHKPLRSVPEMAAFYLSEVRQVQPRGPYSLAGICVGSYVAYEMAQQLLRQGESVLFLVLLDVAQAPATKRRKRWWRALHGVVDGARQLWGVWRDTNLRRSQRARRAVFQACRQYVPQPYPGPIHLMCVDQSLQGRAFRHTWEGLAGGGLHVFALAGTHGAMFKTAAPQAAQYLSETLRRLGDEAQAAGHPPTAEVVAESR